MLIKSKGTNLKLNRMKKGYSLRGLSIKSGIHYSTISNAENNKGAVSPNTAKSICDALKIEFDELFEIIDETHLSI